MELPQSIFSAVTRPKAQHLLVLKPYHIFPTVVESAQLWHWPHPVKVGFINRVRAQIPRFHVADLRALSQIGRFHSDHLKDRSQIGSCHIDNLTIGLRLAIVLLTIFRIGLRLFVFILLICGIFIRLVGRFHTHNLEDLSHNGRFHTHNI